MVRIGFIQTSPQFGQKKENFKQIEKMTEQITADLLVLPELFATGYTFTSKKEAEEMGELINGPTFQFLTKLSYKTNAVIVGGFIEIENKSIFNAAMIVYNSELIGIYRKIHLYNKEKLWFTPGNRPLQVFNVKNMKIGMMICFDWMFPEVARSLTLLGCDIIAHSANLVLPYCQNAMITRCLENGVYAVTANRIGEEHRGEDYFKFTGESQITGPKGQIIKKDSISIPSVQIAEVELNYAKNKALNPYNDLIKDRHPEYYIFNNK